METIGTQQIWTYFGDSEQLTATSITAVWKSIGTFVQDYLDLARRIAALQCLNRDNILMFRGQSGDHLNRSRNTTLKPTIARPSGSSRPDYVRRFEILRRAEDLLVEQYSVSGYQGVERLRRQRILRWAILQHYGVCPTPLLDVTHSLRIAASFAADSDADQAYLFALGLPNLSGAITASAEAGLQVVRLSSVCPPEAVRPHVQEGYLLGEYPDLDRAEQKHLYPAYEIDFGLRLVAKFRFEPSRFWLNSRNFPPVPRAALYP